MNHIRPVILIHGIWATSTQMKRLAFLLKQSGFSIKLYEYHPNNGSISLHIIAKDLQNFIERENIHKCDIVGYSMGGIIAQLYIQRYGGHAKVKKCVTISSPHHGSYIAYLFKGKGAKELRPHSSLINTLLSEATTTETQWLSIYTPLDLMVIPSSGSKINFGENKITLVLSHPLMITSKKVAQYVIDFLN